jgi:glycosyltransferase involved in cell wall biosynthesis
MKGLVHLMEGGYGMCSRAMMMADIADLLPDYAHVWMSSAGVAEANPHLDAYMLSKGVEVVYMGGGSDLDLNTLDRMPCNVRRFVRYCAKGGLTLWELGHVPEHLEVRNVPRADTFAKSRSTVRSNVRFHVGLLHGERHGCVLLEQELARRQPENSTLFITTFENRGGPDVFWADKFMKEEVFACPYRAGAVHKYLEWLDVLVMSASSISDRLRLEAEAAGVPVIMGDSADDILETVNRVRTNRETYNLMRSQCLRNAAGNDMAFEIVKIKTHLERSGTWKDTTPLSSGQEPTAA